MTPERLESLLDGGQETAEVEFKGAMSWDRNSLVKDILALSNTVDGGLIIVGVQDGTFLREGVTPAQAGTFSIDVMRDQVAPFADPRVEFGVELIRDKDGLLYVVINVATFDETPVICARDGTDVHKGTIYYRSRARRAESARVSSSTDMRDIIEAAVARRSRKLRRLGFLPPEGEQYDFNAELGGL